jgi:uncharacterized membrane protein
MEFRLHQMRQLLRLVRSLASGSNIGGILCILDYFTAAFDHDFGDWILSAYALVPPFLVLC